MNKTLKIFLRYLKKIDKFLLLSIILCSGLSVLLLYSIYYNKVSYIVHPRDYQMQFAASILGIIILLVMPLFDYRKIAKLWFLYVPFAVVINFLTFTPLGIQVAGTDDKAWISLGFTTLQPSEILKIAFILSFSYHLYKVGDKINQPSNLLLLILHGLGAIGIIVLQGDDGTAIVFAFIFVVMLFVAGLSWKYIITVLIASPVAVLILWNFLLSRMQKNRILAVLNPELDPVGAGNQQRQGKIALGSGQLTGKGLFGGHYSYVSEVHNDFIFSYLGQTLGFIGCIAFCALAVFICYKILSDAIASKDTLGKYICCGVFAMLFVHYIMNIGMVLGVMPVIGVPLPFISAGGTAVVFMYVAIGLVMSVYAHSEKTASIFSYKKVD